MKKSCKSVFTSLLVITIITVVCYTIYDNNHIVVRNQNIEIVDLPRVFDGFTILQISDLHGKEFGQHQSELIHLIQSTPHDIIVFTGDMNPGYDSIIHDSVNDLLSALIGEKMIWVDGNCGPYAVYMVYGSSTGQLTPQGVQLTELGVHILVEPYRITRADSSIYISPKITQATINDNIEVSHKFMKTEGFTWKQVESYYKRLLVWYEKLSDKKEIIIAIDHFPEQSYLSEPGIEAKPLSYALMISGHTHGGQIRLPLLGAIYVPTITSFRGGWFPDDEKIHGLCEVSGVQQYISSGLGASHTSSLFAFRFLCSPEINRIVLRCLIE